MSPVAKATIERRLMAMEAVLGNRARERGNQPVLQLRDLEALVMDDVAAFAPSRASTRKWILDQDTA